MHTELELTDLEVFDQQDFENKLKTDKNTPVIKLFRDALEKGHQVLKERFEANHNATSYVLQRAWLVDQFVLQAWQHCTFPEHNSIAILAVGGYGRGELHPKSDVDLLILLESELDDATKACIEQLIQFLWDIGLKVGQGVRTIAECKTEAAADITVATNLIEARLLTGPEHLFKALETAIAPDRTWDHKAFFSAKVKEQKKRHDKYEDSAYKLEPNVKEGPGGLRDIQMIGWVAKRYFGAISLHDLIQHGFLTEKEYKSLSEAQEFLWEVRCFLHLLVKRSEDRLLFDYQSLIAKAFDCKDDEAGLGVEKLMKRYYRTVKEIRTLNDMLLQLFQEVILYADTPTVVHPLNKRFQIRNNFIEVTNKAVFVNYPFALLEIFLLIQQNPSIQGIRASTIRLILHYNYLIDDIFRQDLRSRSLFLEIFRHQTGLTHVLRKMNRYGILAAYIPSFGQIVGQMQYDLFHIYTVEQHTLFVLRNLRRFNLPEFFQEFPFCSKLIKTIPKAELLYLAAFFHDIAKGRGGSHAELGAIDALNFCHLHGLSDNDARLVAWLVRYHLIMSMTAQRKDISDPEVIKAFSQQVTDTLHLDYLYLLTVADIRATNPKLWNSWKDSLLIELYKKTKAFLSQDDDNILNTQLHIKGIQNQARQLMTDSKSEDVSSLWQKLGDEYFLSSSPEEIARETEVILKETMPIVLARDNKAGTGFISITADRNYLFADATAFFERKDLSIIEAYIVPGEDDYNISAYTVLENDGEKISSAVRINEIVAGLKQVLSHDNKSPPPPISRRLPRQMRHFTVATNVDFKQDHVNNHTIMEIKTIDRPGVLSRIAEAFKKCKIRVKNAQITTFGSHVEDVFFITDYENHALFSTTQLNCLRQKLFELLDNNVH
jgi:[protein-PII] uridylyltransferase